MAFAHTSISIHPNTRMQVSARTDVSQNGQQYRAVTIGSWSDDSPEVKLFLVDGDPLYDVLSAYEEAQKNG